MTKQSSKTQLDRFKEAAREIGADDYEERFNEKLRKLVKDKPRNKGIIIRKSKK